MPVSSVANRPPCAHDAAEAPFAPGTARHRAINREKHRSADAYDARGVRGNVPDRAQRETYLFSLRQTGVHAPQAPERVSFAHDQPPVPVHVSKVSRPSYPKHHQLTRWYVERPQDARERASRLAPRPPVQSDTGVPSIVKNARLKAPLFSIKPHFLLFERALGRFLRLRAFAYISSGVRNPNTSMKRRFAFASSCPNV